MKLISNFVGAWIEGAILYVSYYGSSAFWWMLFNPYAG